MNDLVVVDTSIFIEYLRGDSSDTLSILILNNQVLLSPIVRLELLLGVRRKEYSQLERLLDSLRQIPEFQPVNLYQRILFKAKGSGLLGGLADLMIISDAIINKASLFTVDQKMIKLAKKLKVVVLK